MHKLDQQGSLLIPLVLVGTLLLFAIGFGAWAFTGRQDYKNNVDAKIVEAVEASDEKLSIEKEAEFAEREKDPNKSYQGPATYGSLLITYPKTWSAYIVEKSSGTTALDGYLHPNFIPDISSDHSFALRFEVLNTSYDQVIKQFDSKVRTGKVTVVAYRAPKVQEALGARISGEIDTKKQGIMVLLPVRDKTIRIWTEGEDFKGDFDRILEQLTFNQ